MHVDRELTLHCLASNNVIPVSVYTNWDKALNVAASGSKGTNNTISSSRSANQDQTAEVGVIRQAVADKKAVKNGKTSDRRGLRKTTPLFAPHSSSDSEKEDANIELTSQKSTLSGSEDSASEKLSVGQRLKRLAGIRQKKKSKKAITKNRSSANEAEATSAHRLSTIFSMLS